MMMKKTGILSVPGAILFYEVRGSGPLLLLIHGGNSDANVFTSMAEHLADQYTVITYDRRGHSHSKLVNSAEDYRVETHSDDAFRLLTELANEPVYVFGSSSGAVIGLDLAIRHPEQISMLIAHEPPLTHLLSGDVQRKAKEIQENLEKTSLSEGVIPAIKQFATVLGMENANHSQSRLSAEQLEYMLSNMRYFVMHEAPVIRRHMLDLESLKSAMKSASMRILIGSGSSSGNSFPCLCALALAEKLGLENVEFPGNHLGYVNHSKEFAGRLHKALEKKSLNRSINLKKDLIRWLKKNK